MGPDCHMERGYTGLDPIPISLQDTWEFVFTEELFEQYKRAYFVSDKDPAVPTGGFLEQMDPAELGDDEENAMATPFRRKQVCVCACVCVCMSCHGCKLVVFCVRCDLMTGVTWPSHHHSS